VQPTVRIHRDGFVFVLADVLAGFGYRLDVREERGDAHHALTPPPQQQQHVVSSPRSPRDKCVDHGTCIAVRVSAMSSLSYRNDAFLKISRRRKKKRSAKAKAKAKAKRFRMN
jgi:hypothetical protein